MPWQATMCTRGLQQWKATLQHMWGLIFVTHAVVCVNTRFC